MSDWHVRMRQKKAKGGSSDKSEEAALHEARMDERTRKFIGTRKSRLPNALKRLWASILEELPAWLRKA